MVFRFFPIRRSSSLARPAMVAGALSALAYSCDPEFDRLTSDYGKGSGGLAGQGGNVGCTDEPCGGAGSPNGGSTPTGGTDAGEGGATGGAAGEGGVGDAAGAGAGGVGEGGAAGGAAGEGGGNQGGTAGGGTGGKGGTGGIEPDPDLPVLDCGQTECADADILVDMEANDGKVCATNGRAGGTFFFNDGTAAQWPEADPLGVTQFSPLPACRETSAVAIHTKGNAFTSWGGGVVIKFSDTGWDASEYDGLTFWAMSSTRTRLTFAIATMDTQDVAFGGECVPSGGLQCADHFATVRALTPTWAKYTITFDDLRQRGYGVPAPTPRINEAKMTELNITVPTGVAFDVWLDDMVFFTNPE